MLEAMDQFLPNMDEQIAAESAKIFIKQGLDIRLGARVTDVAVNGDNVSVAYTQGDSSEIWNLTGSSLPWVERRAPKNYSQPIPA